MHGVNFKQNRRLLLLRSFGASFRKTALNSDFISIFFMILYMRNGVNFEHHRKLLSLWTFAVSFRSIALNSDFT